MMELADVSDSKSDGSNTVPVRPRLPAPAGASPCTHTRVAYARRVLYFFHALASPTSTYSVRC